MSTAIEREFALTGRVLGLIRDTPGITAGLIFEALDRPTGGVRGSLAHLEFGKLITVDARGGLAATPQPIEPIRPAEVTPDCEDVPRRRFVRGWRIRRERSEWALLYGTHDGDPWELHHRIAGWWRCEWTGCVDTVPPVGVHHLDPLAGIPYLVWIAIRPIVGEP